MLCKSLAYRTIPNTVFSAVTYYLRKKAEEWKKRDKVILSIKDLVFKKRLAKKLVEQHIGLYIVEVVFTNTVKLRLLTSMRIYLVMNVS